MTQKRQSLGRLGEKTAVACLRKNGYKIIEKNYKTKCGEIDIIGKDGDRICFIEVRSRSGDKFGPPELSIDRLKQLKISRTALIYIKKRGLLKSGCRFDCLTVCGAGSRSPRIKLIKNAFDLAEPLSY